ncbi:hypothetical protein ACFL6D_05235 [Spirochaetota bacterium]
MKRIPISQVKCSSYLFILLLTIIMHLHPQNESASFQFLFFDPDAYLRSLAGADIIPLSSSSLFNNPGALAASKNDLELAIGYYNQSFLNNSLSLYGLSKLGSSKIGWKGLYYFTPVQKALKNIISIPADIEL